MSGNLKSLLENLKHVPAFEVSKKTKVKKPKGKPVSKNLVLGSDIHNVLVYNNPIKQVLDSDRPENVLDRKKGDYDSKSIVEIVDDFCEEGVLEDIEQFLLEQGNLKVFSYNDYSYPDEIPLSLLNSSLTVQRPINKRHLRNIQYNYNKNKLMYPSVLKIKHEGKWYYYIVDGQHTAATQGIRARLGLIKEVTKENWKDVKIRCTVIECNDFTFAREVFLGINGDDKEPLVYFDKWKNYVLGARQDDTDNEFWQDCLERQEILEAYGIVPIHEGSEDNIKRKPGAFIRVDLIEELKPEDVRFIARLHQMLWDDKNVDAFEILPMLMLRDKIKRDSSLDNLHVQKFFKELGALIRHTVGSPAGIKKLTQKTWPLWFKATHPGEDKKPVPADASLALLLFMYYEAGGKHEGLKISNNFLKESYTKRGQTLFDFLSLDDEVNENLKSLIRDSKQAQ